MAEMTGEEARALIAQARHRADCPNTPVEERLRLRFLLDQIDGSIEGLQELRDVARRNP